MLKRAMLGGLICMLILGSWIGNILYYQQLQLKEPIILKQDMTLTLKSDYAEMLYFNVLENKHKGKKVTAIQLPDDPQILFQIYPDQTYTHHVMMKAAAGLNQDELGAKLPLTIKEVLVYYNEGPPATVPIGEIRIEKASEKRVLDMVSASSSSGGAGDYMARLLEKVELDQVDVAVQDQLKAWVDVELNGVPVEDLKFPMALNNNEAITLSYHWDIPDDELDSEGLFQSFIRFHFRTQDGHAIVNDVPISQNMHLSEVQVRHLVRSGGDQQ